MGVVDVQTAAQLKLNFNWKFFITNVYLFIYFFFH